MKLKYKYDPQDYKKCHLLSDDMRAFYEAYEKHKNNPNTYTELLIYVFLKNPCEQGGEPT